MARPAQEVVLGRGSAGRFALKVTMYTTAEAAEVVLQLEQMVVPVKPVPLAGKVMAVAEQKERLGMLLLPVMAAVVMEAMAAVEAAEAV